MVSSKTAREPVYESGPVVQNLEETALIRACLADFATDGPRRLYLDWLEGKGQRDKAAILRATIAAFEHGQSDTLRYHTYCYPGRRSPKRPSR